jgi:glycogen debranching enzyme
VVQRTNLKDQALSTVSINEEDQSGLLSELFTTEQEDAVSTQTVRTLMEQAKSELQSSCISPQGFFYAAGDAHIGRGSYRNLFGRDAAKTIVLLLEYMRITGDLAFLPYIKITLYKLTDTMGRRHDIETGEKPGGVIHELKTKNYDHLRDNNWPIDADGIMRIYRTADATALYLIAVYRFWQQTGDNEFLEDILPSIRAAAWAVVRYGDYNGDGLLDYFVDPACTKNGLAVHSWMDSKESIGGNIIYPVAPLEVQGYGFLAAKLWAAKMAKPDQPLSEALQKLADRLKELTFRKFAKESDGQTYLASIVDGEGKTDSDVRSNMGHLLWACLTPVLGDAPEPECVLSEEGIKAVVARTMQPDMLDPEAGLRTLAKSSPRFNPTQYHNGAVWPVANALNALGMRYMGYEKEAQAITRAMFSGLTHFGKPGMELYWHDEGQYGEYKRSGGGAPGNYLQAWSLAAVLALGAWEVR